LLDEGLCSDVELLYNLNLLSEQPGGQALFDGFAAKLRAGQDVGRGAVSEALRGLRAAAADHAAGGKAESAAAVATPAPAGAVAGSAEGATSAAVAPAEPVAPKVDAKAPAASRTDPATTTEQSKAVPAELSASVRDDTNVGEHAFQAAKATQDLLLAKQLKVLERCSGDTAKLRAENYRIVACALLPLLDVLGQSDVFDAIGRLRDELASGEQPMMLCQRVCSDEK
jgi:hypothetical protein